MSTQHTRIRSGKAALTVLGVATLCALPIACTGGDSLTNPPTNEGAGAIPWGVNLNYHAINMAVGDQVQLSVAPTDNKGQPFVGAPVATYTSSDTAVKVDAAGRLTASTARANVLVIAWLRSLEGNWTLADSARVTVLATPYAAAGIRMIPNGPLVQPANRTLIFNAIATDANGNAVLGTAGDTIRPMTWYQVSTPRNQYYVSTNWTGSGIARNLSKPTVTAKAYVFGAEYSHSIALNVVHPDSVVLFIHRVSTTLTPSPSAMSMTNITILQNGKVNFRSQNTTKEDDIVFDNQTGVVGGNIPVVSTNPGSVVTFPNVGAFTYRSASGFTGTITVVPQP